VVIELNWLKKKVNNTFIEADWLNILVKTKLRHSSWTSTIMQPHTWTPRHCCLFWRGWKHE